MCEYGQVSYIDGYNQRSNDQSKPSGITLLCVCYVLLCVLALQHDKERNFPCKQCDHKAGSSNNLKQHVEAVVSRSVCVTHLLLSDVLCYVLLCVPLY
jgi:hypothetical protein